VGLSEAVEHGKPRSERADLAVGFARVAADSNTIFSVLRIRHERVTAHLSAPAPVEAANRSPNEVAAALARVWR
jgi:hypothetical protein